MWLTIQKLNLSQNVGVWNGYDVLLPETKKQSDFFLFHKQELTGLKAAGKSSGWKKNHVTHCLLQEIATAS